MFHPGHPFATRCPRCLGRGATCLCDAVRPVASRTRVVVVRHVLELTQPSNTARIAMLALTNAELHTYGARDAPLDAATLTTPGTWLLFPEGPTTLAGRPPPERLLVLDGSWSQAKHMIQRLPGLLRLPRLSVAVPEGRVGLRKAPEGGLSTLEAIARALAELEGPSVAEPLDALHQAMLSRVKATRGYV